MILKMIVLGTRIYKCGTIVIWIIILMGKCRSRSSNERVLFKIQLIWRNQYVKPSKNCFSAILNLKRNSFVWRSARTCKLFGKMGSQITWYSMMPASVTVYHGTVYSISQNIGCKGLSVGKHWILMILPVLHCVCNQFVFLSLSILKF